MRWIDGFLTLIAIALGGAALGQGLPNFGGSQLPNGAGGSAGTNGVTAQVPTTSSLALASTAVYPSGVWRVTYGNGNGAPPLFYTSSAGACTFNAGAGDNGAQVPSADGKCWLASFPAGPLDVRQWGALSDGGSPIAGAGAWTATANGTTTLTVSSTNGMATGQHLTTVGWATSQATSLAIIPNGTTIVSVGSGNVITSQAVPTMLTIPSVAWADNVLGTDNTAAFQAMFDYGLQAGVQDFQCEGNFKITSTLHAGWGQQGVNGGLYGPRLIGGLRAGYNQLPGCTLYPTQTNSPALDFQSDRQIGLYGVGFWGRAYNYLLFLTGPGNNLSSNVNDWLPPEFTTAAALQGTITTITLTANNVSGTIQPGSFLTGTGVTAGTTIAAYGTNGTTGTGGTGTYSLNNSMTVASPVAMVASASSGGFVQHAPWVAVTVDAYSGTQPSPAYPNLTFPAWTGLSSQYGKAVSSDIELRNVNINGFGVAFAVGLNTQNNGDFLKATNMNIAYNSYGLSITNTQSRNVNISNIVCGLSYTVIDQTSLGMQQGEFNGPISNIGCSPAYQMFNFGSLGLSGPLDISEIYCEGCVRIGNFISNTSFNSLVDLRDSTFNLSETIHGQIPACFMTATNAIVRLTGINFNGNQRISNLFCGTAQTTAVVNGGSVQSATVTPPDAARLQAINYSGGLLAGIPRYNSSGINNWSVPQYYLGSYYPNVSGALGSYPHADTLSRGTLTNRFPMTQDMKTYLDTQGRYWQMTVPAPLQIVFPSSPSTQISVLPTYAGDTVTFNYCSVYQGGTDGIGYVMTPGDILFHFNSGTVFIVTSVGSANSDATCTFVPNTSSVVTAVQQNNMTVTPGTNTWTANLNATPLLNSGNTALIKTGVVIPGQLEYGIFTNGSTAVTNVTSGGFVGSDLGTYYHVSDIVLSPFQFGAGSSPWPMSNAGGNTYAVVTALNPGSITLGSAATASGLFPIFPYELSGRTVGGGNGNAPTVGTTGGVCTATTPATGGAFSGTVTLTGVCATTNTIALTAMPTQTTGYNCNMTDRNLGTVTIRESSTTTNSVTFTMGATSTGGTDVLQYNCTPY